MEFRKLFGGIAAGAGLASLIPGLVTGLVLFTQTPAVWTWIISFGAPWIINVFGICFIVASGGGAIFVLVFTIQFLLGMILGALGFVAVANKGKKTGK
jgi:hypothetical protein